MDPARYPRLCRYLRMLPDGWLSHPQCEGRASVYRELVDNAPKRVDFDGLDPLLRSYIEEPVPPTSWIPEVISCGIVLAYADRAFGSEDAYVTWVDEIATASFRTPTYRMLMVVASPARLAEGAERRWRVFHVGSSYETVIGKNGSESRITYPPYLFDRFMLRANSRVVRAAMRASGAPQAEVELVEWTPTATRFRSVWHPERGR